jgi:hypothetical protein
MPSMNTNKLVRNIRGTASRNCRCGSWLDHWRNETRSRRRTCAVLGCGNPAAVGGHVVDLDNRGGGHHWIAPLCHSHNHHALDADFWLDGRIALASANTRVMGCYR